MLKMECYCSLNQYPKVLEITEELITRDCDYLEEVFEYISPILNDLDMNKEARDFVDRGLALFPDNLILKMSFATSSRRKETFPGRSSYVMS